MQEELEISEQDEQDLFEHYRFIVDRGQSPLRIDKYLMHKIQNSTRSRIQAAAEVGSILVNDKPIKSNYKVKPSDIISIVLPDPPRVTDILPEDIPLDIKFEDDDLLIVNKPAGMVVHPGFNNYNGTLVNALAFHFEGLPNMKGNVSRPGLVHRIDKDTTGLLVISKNENSMTALAKQFFDHSIARKYIALVWGDIEEDGRVEGYIARNIKDRRFMSMYDTEAEGKWSATNYKVLERLNYVTLIECELETGRTHQIRAHLKHIGHPLFNDATYGGDGIIKGTVFTKYKQFVDNCFKLCGRQALHATSLGFMHPTKKESIYFEEALPQDMVDVIDKWRKYSKTAEKN